MSNSIEKMATIAALKKVHETMWNGNTVHNDLDGALRAILLETNESGWYNPQAVKITGLSGYYLVLSDGRIYWESRVIKTEKGFLIEYLTNSGYSTFEENYLKLINEK